MKYLITCLSVCVLSGAAFATTWTVDDDGKADFDNIQAAVDAASDGDEILVMPGTYTSTANEVVRMLGKEIWLHSSNGAGVTIIDGEGTRRGITCNSGETSSTVIEGFTVSNGNSNWGGGLEINTSNPVIINCIFTNNNSTNGGGIYNNNSSPTLTNCTFTGNTAVNGGGVYNYVDSSPTLTDCTFTGNTASSGGGGMRNTTGSSPTLTNCTFESNTADSTGGGMYNSSSNPTLTNCTFTNNTAGNNGGGIYTRSSIGLLHCTFVNNSANAGGAIYVMGDKWAMPNCALENCTLQNNDGSYGGGIYSADAYLTLGNCLVTGNNGSGLRNDMMGILSLSFTTVCANLPEQIIGSWENQSGNWVNIDCPPEEGACCTDNNIVCTVSTELTCMQFGGDWKGENIDCADSECAIPCLGDVTGDGQVDVSDILVIISVWGACP